MIITKEITLKVNPRTVSHYKKLGYNINGCEIITVPVEHLPSGSKILVHVKCDICEKEKELSYKSYNSNVSKYPIYACCEKCANKKRELTCLEISGVSPSCGFLAYHSYCSCFIVNVADYCKYS
jgi:hypothetical protein